MAYNVTDMSAYIPVGNRGDFGHTVEIDVSAWDDLSPDSYAITYMRPGEDDVYPVDAGDISVAAGILTWTIAAAVTDIEGIGSVVVECYVGSTLLAHSDKAHMIIGEGHDASGDAPEPLASYIEKWATVDAEIESLDYTLTPTVTIEQDTEGTHLTFGIPVTENLLMRDIEGTTQTATLNDDETVAQIVHTDTGTSAVIRTDVFSYDGDICTQVRTLAAGPSLTIVSNLITLSQTIGSIEL
jgi:hypothetical protein